MTNIIVYNSDPIWVYNKQRCQGDIGAIPTPFCLFHAKYDTMSIMVTSFWLWTVAAVKSDPCRLAAHVQVWLST